MFLHLPRSVARLGVIAITAGVLAASPLAAVPAGASQVRAQSVPIVNRAPLAGNVDMSGAQDVEFYLPLSGLDPDGDAVVFSVASNPTHGTLTGLYTGAVTWGQTPITYMPAAGFHGTDSFFYRVTDSHGASDVAKVTVTVTPNAPAPVKASFWINKVSWGKGLARKFSADVKLTPGDVVLGERWAFGDGASAEGATVNHSYAHRGTYSATLTVETASGTVKSVTRTVHI
jgi:hypothetical protein